MKLFELKRGAYFEVLEGVAPPPDSLAITKNKTYRLNTLDGMFSHCSDEDGNVFHIFAGSEVKEVDGPVESWVK